MKIILPIISIALLVSSSISQAEKLFLQAGLHFGGDKLASVTFTDGTTETMHAGGMISFSAGLISEIEEGLELRASIGIKFDTITASNGDMDFTRYPINAMVFKKGELLNVGIGATYHLSPSFQATGPLTGNITYDFDNALGFVVEVDYPLNEKSYLGIKATAIDYTLGSATINGNSLGVVVGIMF